jgi:type II secretory pathway component PulK
MIVQETTLGSRSRRRGSALLVLIVVLTLLGIVLSAIAVQIVSTRRILSRREHQLQATWLARSGAEVTASKWLNDPKNYRGEDLAVIPESQVKVVVKVEGGRVVVKSEARYPLDQGSHAIVRTVERRYRVVEEKSERRLAPSSSASDGD